MANYKISNNCRPATSNRSKVAIEPISAGSGFQEGIADQVTLYQRAQLNLPGIPVIQEGFGGLAGLWQRGRSVQLRRLWQRPHLFRHRRQNFALGDWIGVLNRTRSKSRQGKPVIITEAGYYTTGSTTNPNSVDLSVQAKYTLDLVLDSIQAGNAKTYLYELLDQKSGDGSSEDNFGLFYSDGTPKPAATAIRNLLTLLTDPGSSASGFPQGSMTYSLSGLPSGGNSFLMEKSDGSYWLAVWDDTRLSGPVTSTDIAVPPAPVTINLGFTANIAVFDPLTGTAVIQAANGVSNAHHQPAGSSGAGGGPPCQWQHDSAASRAAARLHVEPSFTVPGGETVAAGQTIAVAGVQFDDSAAANAAGDLSLNVSSIVGNFSMTDDAGDAAAPAPAQHRSSRRVLLAQLNADLATLSYTAGECRSRPAEHHHQRSERQHLQRCGSGFRRRQERDTPPPSGPSITMPGTETVAASHTLPIRRSDPRRLRRQPSRLNGTQRVERRRRHRHDRGSGAAVMGSGSTTFRAGHVRTDQRRSREPYIHGGYRAATGQISVEVYDELGLSTRTPRCRSR